MPMLILNAAAHCTKRTGFTIVLLSLEDLQNPRSSFRRYSFIACVLVQTHEGSTATNFKMLWISLVSDLSHFTLGT